MAPPSHTPPRPTPVATLDVSQVIRAVENYVATHRPDLVDKIRAHGILMSDNGQFVWELHDEQLNGIEVIELLLSRAS